MKRCEIASLFRQTPAQDSVVTVAGWAKTVRDSKNIGFIALSDGSCFKTLQVVFEGREAGKLQGDREVRRRQPRWWSPAGSC